MPEFTLVDHGAFWPQACVFCQNQNGPLVDSQVELHGNNDMWLYVCQRCAKGIATAFGFSEGKRMDKLETAANELLIKQREVDNLIEELNSAKTKIGEQAAEKRELVQACDELSAHVAQLETSIREAAVDARRHLELVGPGAA